jgi:hypothetical protein
MEIYGFLNRQFLTFMLAQVEECCVAMCSSLVSTRSRESIREASQNAHCFKSCAGTGVSAVRRRIADAGQVVDDKMHQQHVMPMLVRCYGAQLWPWINRCNELHPRLAAIFGPRLHSYPIDRAILKLQPPKECS